MDFDFPPAAEAFRDELRAWLEENLDDRTRGLTMDLEAPPAWLEAMRSWNHRLADAGYAALAWPPEYGGRGLGVAEQVVLAEELDRAGAPGTVNPLGIANIAPAILQYGTEDQKRRFLPPMLRGDEIWCQGFSEPGAGSDLASLTTAAVRDGDSYVVNGQKVWTTLAHVADWCELLVRTGGPELPRGRGVSCLLLDMHLPGVEVRPITAITGDREFNEVFLTDVRVPADALLGPEHGGWMVAMSTLANERSGVAALHLQVRGKIRRLMALAAATPHPVHGRVADDPVVRRRLAAAYVEGEHLKLLADRAVSGAIRGLPPGPESSLAKLVWSELEQELSRLAGTILGPDANAGDWGRDRVYTRSLTIAGGTTQVNKNIIARHILGLPK